MFGNIGLVDADSLYFRICMVTQKQKDIRTGINHSVKDIRRNLGTDNLLFAIKGRENFRNDIYSKYKANRKELEPHLKKALTYAHKYMVDYHGAVVADGMEADDLVSIWAYEQLDYGQDPIVVGIDKDLLQIPGWHYNFVKKDWTHVDPDTGNLNLMLQCLTGDSADNIPGIKGIGPVKAKRILTGVPLQRRWNRVRAAWRQHKAGSPDTSWRLLKMLTSWEEYDELRSKITDETSVSEQHVLETGQANKEDEGLRSIPAGDA